MEKNCTKYKCICGKEFDKVQKYAAHARFCKIHQQHKEDLKKLEETYEYVCGCGRRFKSKNSLKSHARFCDKYVQNNTKYVYVDGIKTYVGDSIYKINNDCYRCECGKEFNSSSSLGSLMSLCENHHNAVNMEMKKRPHEKDENGVGKMSGWEQKSDDEIKEIRKKSGKTLSENIKSGKVIPYFNGKSLTEDTKEKIRISTVNYLQSLLGDTIARYNKKSIDYINNLNEINHWNLQHAENGGEVKIGGYFVDGYDKDLNIVFEYDEKRHYKDVDKNVLKDKDIKRQNFIINKIKCRFFRYNEELDLLYEVTNFKN